MKTELLGQEKNVVKVKLEFEADEFVQALKRTLKDLSQQAAIPGFRKGHAPRKVLEMRFGRESLYSETLEHLIDVKQIIDDYELDTIDNPKLDVDLNAIREGEPVACTLAFEVMPEVELPDIANIEVERLRTNVTEEMVDTLIRHVRKENATTQAVDRPVGNDDLVDINLSISVVRGEGQEQGEPPAPQADKIDLFDENVRKEVREALVGRSKGETAETEFEVEGNHIDRQYAGKRLRYTMTVTGVTEYILPELNEEFYKKLFGENTDIHTDEDFRNKMRADLTAQLDEEHKNDAELRAVEEVTRQAKVEVPATLIRREAQSLRQSDERLVQERHGQTLAGYLGGPNNPDWEKGYTAFQALRAESMVRQSLVMSALAKEYDVSVDKEDVEAELDRRAAAYGVDKNTLMGYLYKNQNALNQVVDELQYSKTVDLLMTKVKVKEVDELTPPAPRTEPEKPEEQPQPDQPQGE